MRSWGRRALRTCCACSPNPLSASAWPRSYFSSWGSLRSSRTCDPFLETVTRVDAATLSIILLVIGVTGLIGTLLVGALLKRSLYAVVISIPIVMAVIAIALIAFGGWLAGAALLLGAWGLIGTPAPVGWGTWLVAHASGGCRSRRRPHGRDHSVRHYARSHDWWNSLRHERLSRDIRSECGFVGRVGAACSCRASASLQCTADPPSDLERADRHRRGMVRVPGRAGAWDRD